MDTVVLACRLILAAVFVVASIGKMLDLQGSRRSVGDFGIPESAARPIGTLLPFAELAAAVLLIFSPTAQWGAIAALILLLSFMAGIAHAMAEGKAPDCNCFGQIHSAPAGRKTLARNGALAAVSVVAIAAGPGPSISAWVGDRSAAELVAVFTGIALLVAAAVAVRELLESRKLQTEIASLKAVAEKVPPGLWVGAMAPEFSLPDPEAGRPLTLARLRESGLPIALVFVGPGCGPCEILIPEVVRWQETMSDRLTIAFVGRDIRDRYQQHLRSGGTVDDTPPALVEELDVLTDVFDAYRVNATPSCVILTPDGTIASATVDGKLGIEALIRQTLSRLPQPVEPAATRPAA